MNFEMVKYAVQRFRSEGYQTIGFTLPDKFLPYWHVWRHGDNLEFLYNSNPIEHKIVKSAFNKITKEQLSLF